MPYEMKAIEMSYFKLEYDGANEDLNKTTRINIQTVQKILNELKCIILKNFSHNELLYKGRKPAKEEESLEQRPIINQFKQNLNIKQIQETKS